ncbi:MAG: prepilin-type N-terminal cleavage/methylation domain-containing protein, partial [Gordonia polyisoprenivorans]|nr:prepilin-type N-terminal cleavage/methylation domain-containing protein [Gordonia polyisoprenivorans]
MNARFRALARRRDAGVTLVELMVAVVVAAIVLALVAGFFVQSVRITTASNSSRQTNDISTNAANRVTSWVRAVTQTPTTDGQKQSILVAKPQYLQFYSFADTNAATPVISKVTIEVVSSQIRISSCPGVNAAGTSTWSFTCTAANTKVQTMVGTVVAPTGSQLPLFTYFPSSVTGNYDTT